MAGCCLLEGDERQAKESKGVVVYRNRHTLISIYIVTDYGLVIRRQNKSVEGEHGKKETHLVSRMCVVANTPFRRKIKNEKKSRKKFKLIEQSALLPSLRKQPQKRTSPTAWEWGKGVFTWAFGAL